jgi:poly-gamma-glutamate synthesis protein (capsule biosynthesis protein)
VRNIAEHRGVEYLFEEVTPVFREADAVVVNLECPLTDTISPVNKKYIFRADARWAKDLKAVGITHAAMANNHTNDQGRRGLQATAQHLTDAGITPLGYGRNFKEQMSPVLIEKDGISVALFNATTLTIENWCRIDDKPGFAQPSEAELLDEIDDFHHKHPDTHIVVVLHWGVEFQPYPSIRQRALAHRLSEAGVAAVIGHHPHILQPIDTIGKMPVYYSIGNFVFDQNIPKAKESMIARLTFHSDGTLKADSISVKIEQGRPVTHTLK